MSDRADAETGTLFKMKTYAFPWNPCNIFGGRLALSDGEEERSDGSSNGSCCQNFTQE
jgi:hypothetical protein